MNVKKFFPLVLAAALQISPMLRSTLPQLQGIAPSSWAVVLKLSAGAIAMFGYHAVSSASTAVVSPATANAVVGHTYTTGAANAAYTMSTAPDVAGSWSVSPNPPAPGLTVSSQYWIGNPTTPGTYVVAVTGWEFAGQTGLSTTKNVTLTVTSLAPIGPGNVTATSISTNQINVTWTDNSTNETSFKIQRAITPLGPWTLAGTVTSNAATFSNTGLNPSTTYYYQVQASNAQGDSAPTNTAFATTVNLAPILNAISNKSLTATSNLTFTALATDTGENSTNLITDFESFAAGTATGTVLFRDPTVSMSTSAFLDNGPKLSSVVSAFPAGHTGTRVLKINWGFTNTTTAPWLRLVTTGATNLPNPVINLNGILSFDIYANAAVKLGLGVRETNSNVIFGGDGGTNGAVEWSGVAGAVSNSLTQLTPTPTRTITSSNWQTVQFNIPLEIVTALTGNGIISTATGKGVLEHLALLPASGFGTNAVYLDNFAIINTNQVFYRLDSAAPAGATINLTNGVFNWTPSLTQTGVFAFAVIATDNGVPNMSATQSVSVTVSSVNTAPALGAVSNQFIAAGRTLLVTNSATDSDFPAQRLTFSFGGSAPVGATINSTNGVFTWPTTNTAPASTNPVTIIVTDNGSPSLSTNRTFNVIVVPRTVSAGTASGAGTISLGWSTIPGHTYQIVYKVSLQDPTWLQFSTNIIATGNFISMPVPANVDSRRFYQIFEVQ